MVDRQDLNFIIENPVYDPIVAKDDLPDVFLPNTRHDVSGIWENLKPFDALEDLCCKKLRIPRRVTSDELANCIDVI